MQMYIVFRTITTLFKFHLIICNQFLQLNTPSETLFTLQLRNSYLYEKFSIVLFSDIFAFFQSISKQKFTLTNTLKRSFLTQREAIRESFTLKWFVHLTTIQFHKNIYSELIVVASGFYYYFRFDHYYGNIVSTHRYGSMAWNLKLCTVSKKMNNIAVTSIGWKVNCLIIVYRDARNINCPKTFAKQFLR